MYFNKQLGRELLGGVKYILPLLIAFLFVNLSFSQSSDNVMTCGIYNKVPADYQPVVSLMVEPSSIIDNKVGNAHVANYSDTYDYSLYCSAGSYGDVGGIILDEGETCASKRMMEVVNTSGVSNAHVQSPDCTDEGCSDAYDYQLCIYPKNYEDYATVLCQIEDNSCQEGETCLFKFSGQQYTYTNAHVYDCDYPKLPANTKAVCCTYTVSNLDTPIIKIYNPFEIGEAQDVFIPLGITRYISVSLFNPTNKPQVMDLYISTDNDENSKIFSNFIWFEDESKKYSTDPKHMQILLNPMEKKAVTINIFGGKIGKYNLYLSKKNEAGEEERIATYSVYILPSRGKGVSGSAPEFPEWAYFIILLSASSLLIFNIKRI